MANKPWKGEWCIWLLENGKPCRKQVTWLTPKWGHPLCGKHKRAWEKRAVKPKIR